MYLHKSLSNGRVYLSIVHGYRDPLTRKVRRKTVKSLGYLDDLQRQYPDPIAHFQTVVAEMNKRAALGNQPVTITFDPQETLTHYMARKNLGYAALSKIYHELGLHIFFYNNSRGFRPQFNTNNIMKLLIYSWLLAPASKEETYEAKDRYFENTDFSLDDVARCLTQVATFKDRLEKHLYRQTKARFRRSTDPVYYNVISLYLANDAEDSIGKKGESEKGRVDPIIQTGILTDTQGIPIAYDLFPANTNEWETVISMLNRARTNYEIGRTIVVADRGINTGDDIALALARGDGYIFSQSLRGGNKELSSYVLDPSGYRQIGDGLKVKSRLRPREIVISDGQGGRRKVYIDEKQIVFYSAERDRKAKAEREQTLLKAWDLVKNPRRYNKATSWDAAQYVKNLVFDRKTGVILTSRQKPVLDEVRLREEEK